MESTVVPTYTIGVKDIVYAVEMSPYEWSHNLICFGMESGVIIGSVEFKELNENLDKDIVYKVIREFHHECRVHSVALSPETSLAVVPKIIKFVTSGSDFKIRLFSSDLGQNETVEELSGHSDYVNSVVFEPVEGRQIASASDDHTCCVWSAVDGQEMACFLLSSPGMAVCWHKNDLDKLMVAEKNGLIHFYNVATHRAIMSLDAGVAPLMAAHWAPSNNLRVAALAAGELLVWDISRISRPVETKLVHSEGGFNLSFSHTSDNHVATTGRPGNLLKVTSVKSKQTVVAGSLMVIGGITWHSCLPYVCVSSDRKLCFWKVPTK